MTDKTVSDPNGTERSESDAGLTDILQRADSALYTTKEHGRNCIQVLAAEGSYAA